MSQTPAPVLEVVPVIARRNRIKVVHGGPNRDDGELKFKLPTIGALQEQQTLQQVRPEGVNIDEAARQFLVDHLVSWNWVDDNGQPLPQPAEGIDVFMELTTEELAWIGQLLQGVSVATVENEKK